MLEVTMADHPRCPHPATFSWNAGMVMHVFKGDSTLRDLEHVQVDGPGVAYLFFLDYRGLKHDASQTFRMHVVEAFSEWIFHSTHFAVIPLPLAEGWLQAVATSERHWQRSRVEHPDCPMHNLISSKSDSTLQLVGSAPTSMTCLGQTEETGGGCTPRVPFLSQEEDPLRDAKQRMAQGIHLHLPQTEEGPTQTCILGGVRHIALAATGEDGTMRSDLHLCHWICQFSSRLTQMWM